MLIMEQLSVNTVMNKITALKVLREAHYHLMPNQVIHRLAARDRNKPY